jgi:hypothetical protein
MSGMGFNRNSMSNLFAYLFGDGSDGDVTISANTDLVSTLNGDIVYKNYTNLTINSGCTLSVSNMCKGLWIRVRGTLTLNGAISMSNKGCYIAGGGSDLYLCYSDIKVPAVGAAGGASVAGYSLPGNAGAAGTDGKCGGGGSGGNWAQADTFVASGAGAYGFVGGGGCGGSGSAGVNHYAGRKAGNPGKAYGEGGGDGVNSEMGASGGGAGGVVGGIGGPGWEGSAENGGVGSGGILIIMANIVAGTGSFLSKGAKGGNAYGTDYGTSGGGGGGGSGGGSIVLFYHTMLGTPTLNADGGLGGLGYHGGAGGPGGAGSCRDYSLAELLSHTRI